MGLDVRAYERLVPVVVTISASDRPEDTATRERGFCSEDCEHVRIYPNPDFSSRADGLKKACYLSRGTSMHFRAGAYSTYNRFREWLCRAALGVTPREVWEARESKKFDGRPFVELIDFSDCEGAIGPTTSAKLAKDFAEHESSVLAKTFSDYTPGAWMSCDVRDDEWNRTLYGEFRRAFEMAAKGGAVRFL